MQLFLNTTSPFARVARMAALHKGLQERLHLVWCDPWADDPALLAVHPQGRIPVLVTDDGHAVGESLLIAQYLDHCNGTPTLCPPGDAGVLARTSVAYGLMEASFATVIARKHLGTAADASVLGQRRTAAIARALQQLEAQPLASGVWTLDALCTLVALEYLQFRLPGTVTAALHPQLCTWLATARQHPHAVATAFPT